MGKPSKILSPAHWTGSYGTEGDTTAIGWSVTDYGADPPGWNGVQLYAGPHHPTPGQTVAGFTIQSYQGPANVTFFVQGFDTLQTGGEDGVESSLGTFDGGVTGTTIGPNINSVTSVDVPTPLQSPTRFLSPSPNPAVRSASFAYYLAKDGNVGIAVYDAKGRRVRMLDLGRRPAGYHSTTWNGDTADGRQVAAGVYFIRLAVDRKKIAERKLVLVK